MRKKYILLCLVTFLSMRFRAVGTYKDVGGFICTFSLSISLSITLRTSKLRNQFTISSKYLDMACYLEQETYSDPISFEVQGNDI